MMRPLVNIEQAAAMLGISKRLMHDLAAPRGPIPCYRLSVRATRFDPADIEAYIQARKVEQFNPVKEAGPARLSSVKLKASDPGSDLLDSFRRLGIDVDGIRARREAKMAKQKQQSLTSPLKESFLRAGIKPRTPRPRKKDAK